MEGIVTDAQIHADSMTYRVPRSARFWRMCVFGSTFFLAVLPGMAQSKRAVESYEKGQKALADRNLAEAGRYYAKAIEQDASYAEAYIKMGELAVFDRNMDAAAKYYEKAVSLKPDAPEIQPAYSWLGNYYLRAGQYEKAAPFLEKFLTLQAGIAKPTPLQRITAKRVTRMRDICAFALQAMQKPLKIEVRRLPETVNGFESQYFPVLTADRENLLFTGIEIENGDESLYLSEKTQDGWSKPKALPAPINTSENEGTASLSADGRTLVFTVCQSRLKRGFGNCDLYIAYRAGNEWSEPENLGPAINSKEWESQPTLSPDGRWLLFASDRPGGIGKRDIWMARKDSTGHWTPAVNAGAAINTTEDDVSPFLHANGRTLFFASDGWIGMGGFDIWMSDWNGSGFSAPENVGYPINNFEDQSALFITSDGKKGLYSQEERLHQDRRQSRLWELDVPEELTKRFRKANVLKGLVREAGTGKPLAATLELVNLKSGSTDALLTSDARTGTYTAVLAEGNEYAVFVQKAGYLYKSLTFDYSGSGGDKVLNIDLEPVKKDRREVLKNVFFESGKWDLEPKSEAELQKLVRLLNENPAITLEVSGHTDDVGDDKSNLELSLRRARSVGDYLIAHGIAATRIKAVGRGETQPVQANTSEENRALNRRIEVKIL